MLPKVNRLRKQADFDKVYKRGKRFSSKHMTLLVLRNDQNTPRFGFVVSKKVVKKIVKRNQLKRALRAAFKKFYKEIKSNKDFVIIGRMSFLDLSGEEREAEVKKMIAKVKT